MPPGRHSHSLPPSQRGQPSQHGPAGQPGPSPTRHPLDHPGAAPDGTQRLHHESQGETPHLFEFSLGVYEERQKQSPREKPKSFSWDVVKYVTGFYKDIYRQI